MIHVRIPAEGTSDFTVYAHGSVQGRITFIEDQGYFARLEGTAAVFYTYPKYRLAYVICEGNPDEGLHDIPEVLHPVKILYTARGRKIDILKRVLWILDRTYGEKAYMLPEIYWYRLCGLIDRKIKRRETEARAFAIKHLTDKYLAKSGSIYNNVD
jgi:hypothetical protein